VHGYLIIIIIITTITVYYQTTRIHEKANTKREKEERTIAEQ